MNQTTLAQYDLDPVRLSRTLPKSPGVYCFKDMSGRMIYVGKAKNLKKRVLSYFKPEENLTPKTAMMMKNAGGLDVLITGTEKEAFILESSLIKKNMPRYNVILRDDKQYPCLRLDMNEAYPRLSIVRRIKKDKAIYFGPFSSANAVRSTLRFVERVFKLRKCKGAGLPKRARPCLNHQMGRCLGPCAREVSKAEYDHMVRQVRLFLEGRNLELIGRLKKDMAKSSETLNFEKAASIRDQIKAIEKTVERQHMVSRRMEDQDIVGLAQKGLIFQVVSLFVRKGYVVGSRNYTFRNQEAKPTEIMEAFLKQYYSRERFIPERILISETVEDLDSIAQWLSDSAGRKVAIHEPLKGENGNW